MAQAATGCYKCGRVGHWSRDCTFDPKPSDTPAEPSKPKIKSKSNPNPTVSGGGAPAITKRSRPRLTADLVLSNDGLGYVLEKIPHMVDIKGGRGHEVEDLGSFLNAYRTWHSRLFPRLSFKRFIEEVEHLGTVRRVRMCLEELRDKVANGADIKECSSQLGAPEGNDDHDAVAEEVPTADPEETFADEFLRDETQDEPSPPSPPPPPPSEEQRARMEANKLKALERARARLAAGNMVEK